MPVITNKLYYPVFAFLMLLMVLVFVPRREIRRLFWFSLLWGSGVDFVLIELFQKLHLYRYEGAFPFVILGSPMWINLAWTPAMILFLYFLPKQKEWYILPLYLGAFSMVGVFIGVFLHNVGLIKEFLWNELLRFPVIYLWFYGAYRHYQKIYSNINQH